jgi:hypothetical protein
MAPPRELGDDPNGHESTDRLLGELVAEVRAVKHTANGASQKIDAVAGKVDALAIVVANQGHLQEDVNELKALAKEQRITVDNLVADKHRREGAIGLVEWLMRHWPFTVLGGAIIAAVMWANGKLHL